MISNDRKTESLIAGSVRARILHCLWKTSEVMTQFKDIKKALKNKHDNVVKRELDILIERGWVEKMGHGQYRINRDAKELSTLMKQLETMPNPDDVYSAVNIGVDLYKEEMKETLKILFPSYKNGPLEKATQRISMTVVGKKLERFDTSLLERELEDISIINNFIGKIAILRLLAEAQETELFYDENATEDQINEAIDDIMFNQEFKLVVSWSPPQK